MHSYDSMHLIGHVPNVQEVGIFNKWLYRPRLGPPVPNVQYEQGQVFAVTTQVLLSQ